MLTLRPVFGLGLLATFLLFCFLLGTTTSATCENCSVSTPCEQVRCTAQGVCEHYPADPAPSGCCSSDADCAAGFAEATDLLPCLEAHCDLTTFTCTNIWTCLDTYPPPPDLGTCETNDDCIQYTTYCNQAVCVPFDPPTCDTRPINRTLPSGCCTHKRDCLEVACMEVDCDTDYSMCIYVEQENCGSGVTATTTPSAIPSPSSVPSASSSPALASPSASSTNESSPIASITPSPSASSSSSASAAPSEEPSASSVQSASASNSASASASPSLSPAPSASASVSTEAASATSTPSTSAAASSQAPSASATLSFVPSLSSSSDHVGVTPLPGTHPDSGGSGFMMIVVVLVIIVVVLFLIGLVVVGLVLRQRYMNDKFQAIDLIDDEEFPM